MRKKRIESLATTEPTREDKLVELAQELWANQGQLDYRYGHFTFLYKSESGKYPGCVDEQGEPKNMVAVFNRESGSTSAIGLDEFVSTVIAAEDLGGSPIDQDVFAQMLIEELSIRVELDEAMAGAQ